MSGIEDSSEFRTSAVAKRKLRLNIEHVLLGMLSVSVALNVGLAVGLNRARTALEPPAFLTGNRAPVMHLQSESGAMTQVSYGSNELPTLLYWFRPSCSWCEANFDNFVALASQAPGKYRFFAVSAASPVELGEYGQSHDIKFPLFSIDQTTAAQYRFAGTPSCVFISPNGTLTKRWIGAFAPSALLEIDKTLKVALPGIVAPRQKE